MPKHRSDGERKSVSCGGVKAASRASGSAKALALTRPKDTDIIKPSRSKSRLTSNTVAPFFNSPNLMGWTPPAPRHPGAIWWSS